VKRVVVRRPGGYEALELTEEAEPSPGPGQVRVAVRAAGVNYADCIVRIGRYEAAKGRYPLAPGFEFAGVVDAVGEGASAWKPGDRVVGITRFGGYASAIVADARLLWPVPEGWSFAEAAAFPAVFLTAYYALFRCAKVEEGELLLIHSAAGGVGTALLQLSKVAGCRAVAVVGAPHKRALCERLGAKAVVVRSQESLWERADALAPDGFDAIFDANGVSTLRHGFKRLAPGGRLVVYGFADIMPRGRSENPSLLRLAWNYLRVPRFSPLAMTTTNRGVLGFNVIFLFERAALADQAMRALLGWVAEGRLARPAVTTYPLAKAAEAHHALESGQTTGKLVLLT
jgi:synaptic vesicle membrane protein VAT-1